VWIRLPQRETIKLVVIIHMIVYSPNRLLMSFTHKNASSSSVKNKYGLIFSSRSLSSSAAWRRRSWRRAADEFAISGSRSGCAGLQSVRCHLLVCQRIDKLPYFGGSLLL
jgi:hypothetical protein